MFHEEHVLGSLFVIMTCGRNQAALCICRQKSFVLTPAKPWQSSIRLIFGRLDTYLTRLDEVYVIVNSAAAYLRLEKIEIGGTHVRCYVHICER